MLIWAEIVCLRQMNELLFASMANMPIWQPTQFAVYHLLYPHPNDPFHLSQPMSVGSCSPSGSPIWVIDMCRLFAGMRLFIYVFVGAQAPMWVCSVRARLIKIINQCCYFVFCSLFCLKIKTIFIYHFYVDIKMKCQPKKQRIFWE